MSNFSCASFERPKMKTVVVLYWSFHIQSTNFMKRKTTRICKKDFENEFKSYKTMDSQCKPRGQFL